MKPTRSSTARIQVQHASIETLLNLMGVAADDCVEAGGLRIEIEILEVVEHIETEARSLDNCGQRKFPRPGLRVHIAPHGENRRDKLELRENFGCAHVSRVNDELHTKQGTLCFGTQQPVSIGNDADPHGGRKDLQSLSGPRYSSGTSSSGNWWVTTSETSGSAAFSTPATASASKVCPSSSSSVTLSESMPPRPWMPWISPDCPPVREPRPLRW